MNGVLNTTAAVILTTGALAGAARAAQAQAPAPQPGARPEAPPRAGEAAAGRSPLPRPSEDAQRFFDQWKQDQAAIIEQLRFLQQQYRDSGRAEDAAAIAAHVRAMQPRSTVVSGVVTPELVNDGLPTRDAPIAMTAFRDRAAETLSFAIRGRDDQPVWGTTTYTDDSGLETAAVHAGLLRAGQTGIIRVKPLPGLERYEASAQNGVHSSAFASSRGSFRFVSADVAKPSRSTSLSSYRDLVGQSITLPLVGAAAGRVWGTDVYTDDSALAAAAVHAGVIGAGEFGYVKVSFLPGQSRYEGSSRGGVNSEPFGAFDGSFRVEPAFEAPVQLPGGEDASRLVPIETLRGRAGTSFVVRVVGAVTGQVWGSGVYTDDSSIAAAAVHAGLLKPGEAGLVRVTLDAGRDAYAPSDRNGVKSQAYGQYPGSFRLERVR